MEINNKFNIGDVVFYPGADMRMARVIKSVVTGFKVTKEKEDINLVYITEDSYGVKESDLFTDADNAKDRLLKIYEENKDRIVDEIEKALKEAKDMPIDELIYDKSASENKKYAEQGESNEAAN